MSVWQQSSGTMSLGSACAHFGITREEFHQSGLPSQWGSYRGNSYDIVAVSDIIKLKKSLVAKAKQAKLAQKREELGEEAFHIWKQEEDEREALAECRKREAPMIESVLKKMIDSGATNPKVSIEGAKITKGVARKIWGVTDKELKNGGEKCGRAIVYGLVDILSASLDVRSGHSYCHGEDYRHQHIVERLRRYGNASQKNQYAAFWFSKLNEYDPRIVEEVVQEQAKIAKEKIQKAQADLFLLKTLSVNGAEDEDNQVRETKATTTEEKMIRKDGSNDTTQRFALNMKIWKSFPGYDKPFQGTIQSYNTASGFYHVKYEDGDEEDLTEREISGCMSKATKRKRLVTKARDGPHSTATA
jgi:hypothetical protein